MQQKNGSGLVIWSCDRLAAAKEGQSPAKTKIVSDADDLMKLAPLTIMQKPSIAPSGDKHDYLSVGIYWWPNPGTVDGLPWIRRDGERNLDLFKTHPDATNFADTLFRIKTLALAARLTGKADYGSQAVRFLRSWFLAPETRMNPNFNYTQGHPGKVMSSHHGIIELRRCIDFLDAIEILKADGALTGEDEIGLTNWFEAMLNWLIESDLGKQESVATNNHGVWYDATVARIAIFVGRIELAKYILANVGTRRIATQISPDGQQPRELKRTLSLHYHLFALNAFFLLARMGETIGIDVWQYRSWDGRSLQGALDFVLPAALGRKPWAHRQMASIESEDVFTLIRLAAGRLTMLLGDDLEQMIDPDPVQKSVANLIY